MRKSAKCDCFLNLMKKSLTFRLWSIGKAFEQRGHEVFSVEWSKDFENIDLYEDISRVTAEDILKLFGKPDVICCIQPPLSGDLPADRRRPGNGLQGI